MPGPMATSRVPRRADVVVVGGGCMGTSIAFHLVRRGVDVVLVERGHVASGATGHSGALVRQHYEARIGIRLARESLGFFRRFEKETGYSCDFRTTGFLSGTRHRDLAAFEALLSLLRSEGVKAEQLTPSEAKGIEPQLEVSDYAAVVHDPEAGYADPIATSVGFAQSAAGSGAVLLENRDVSSVVIRSGRIASVRIRGRSTITTDRVVLAAGNWTPELARALRVPLRVRFVRGDIVILRRPVGFGSPPKIHFDFYGNTYVRPEGEKDVLVGYMDTDPRKTIRRHLLSDDTVPSSTVRDLRTRLMRRFPVMARAQPRGGWAGVYDVTPDSYPILDRVGPEGLYLAAGFSGHGFKLSPEVGRLMAEYVATGRKPEILVPLRFARFRENRPIKPEAPFPAKRGPRLP
ncbi:MAG: FAD-binding oxidoreductase [Methanobacteriota archaeon]|nr:MAG: FAD-binding oxidoreductase [Euryarchaeota archaeon]